jgi:hypothetical protein
MKNGFVHVFFCSRNAKMASTLECKQTTKGYNLLKDGDVFDPFVNEVLRERFDRPSYELLRDCSPSGYCLEWHQKSLIKYQRSATEEARLNEAWKNSSHIAYGFSKLEEELRETLCRVRTLHRTEIEKVDFFGWSSAGYGYFKMKQYCHDEAMQRALSALRDYEETTNYCFPPCVVTARCTLSLKVGVELDFFLFCFKHAPAFANRKCTLFMFRLIIDELKPESCT